MGVTKSQQQQNHRLRTDSSLSHCLLIWTEFEIKSVSTQTKSNLEQFANKTLTLCY